MVGCVFWMWQFLICIFYFFFESHWTRQKSKFVIKKWNMHIRNCQTQKTQLPNTDKKKRKREKKRERGRYRERASLIKWSVSKQTPQTINKIENPRGYRLGTVSGKTICHWGFKPGSRAPTSLLSLQVLISTNKYKLSWWNNSNPPISLTMLHAKAHKHIKHKKPIALQSQRGQYSVILLRPEHLESN